MPNNTVTTNPAPFVIQPHLTAIALMYQNAEMIADQVLPRVPVTGSTFKYSVFDKGDMMTIPDTKVGRTSRPNEVDWHATELAASVLDYGLEEAIPQDDIDNAAGTNMDPAGMAVRQIMELVTLSREKRVADLVFNANSYATANKTTLTGTSQWSDPASDPAAAIQDARDSMIMTPNVLVLGRRVATQLFRHQKILKAYHGNLGDAGKVTADFLASYLEFDKVLIGSAWANIAKKGQTVSVARLWGLHAAMLYVNPVTVNTKSMTFGITAQWGEKIAGSRPDPDLGLKGGTRVRAGEQLKELVLANDLGYFWQNAVAS